VRISKKKGLDAVAVTDHNNAKAWPKFRGMPIIKGVEAKTTAGELICLFLEELPRSLEGLTQRDKADPLTTIDEVHEQEGIVSMAHPFGHPKKPFLYPKEMARKVDAVETLNGQIAFHANKRALEFAADHGLPGTGGSDAHFQWELGTAYTVAEVDSLEGLRKAIKKKKTIAKGSCRPHVHHWLTKPVKWGLFGRPAGFHD
jgi:predicted metal-dependent phosphoesterase TrpH